MSGRRWAAALVGVAGCTVTTPVGTYRLPIQAGEREVVLGTFVARLEDMALVLLDAETGAEFGRGLSRYRWNGQPEPFVLREGRFPVSVYLRDGVFQDAVARPWATAPSPPVEAEAEAIVRARLVEGARSTTFFASEGSLFASEAASQPEPSDTAPVLDVLNSPAGAGLVLPTALAPGLAWKDAVSTLVPPDPSRAVPCGRALVSTSRVEAEERVTVPAGVFDAVRVGERPDSCLHAAPEAVKVYAIERWYARGVGPVRMRYQASDGLWREYLLVGYVEGAPGATSPWPLEAGRSWTYEVRGPDGAVLDRAATVRVEAATRVGFP
jgi:hypothetical protein